MPVQIQKTKQTQTKKSTEQEEIKTPDKVDHSELDDLLDEIDSVLEQNAEEFVKQYIQRGGQ